MDQFITQFFHHIEFYLLIVALVLGSVAILSSGRKLSRQDKASTMLTYCLLFPVAMSLLWRSVIYTFLPQTAASMQHALPSPFEWQISAAYLGTAIVALIASFRKGVFSVASIILIASIHWGAVITKVGIFNAHVHTFAPSAMMTLTQMFLPMLLMMFYRLQRETESTVEDAAISNA